MERASGMRILGTILLVGACLQAGRATNNAGPNPCEVGQREMYHPYPGDASRFIQCNKFGHSFIRHCNHGQVWSQGFRTCVTGSKTTDIVWDEYQGQTETYQGQSQTYNGHGVTKAEDKRAPPTYGYKAMAMPTEHKYEKPKQQQHHLRALGYVVSPLPYMFQLGGQHTYGYNGVQQSYANSGKSLYANAGSGQKSGQNFNYGSAYGNPYQYYFRIMPAQTSTSNKRFMSTAYGTAYQNTNGAAQSGSYGNAYGNTHGNSYGNGYDYWQSLTARKPASTYQQHVVEPVKSVHRFNAKSATVHVPAKTQPVFQPRPQPRPQPQPRPRPRPQPRPQLKPQPAHNIQCSDPHIRYLPDPTNQHQYQECLSRRLLHHHCESNSVWVQPLRMCVDVNDDLSTTVPTNNPCAGSDEMYKAYPADPSKYIECRAWYSVFVWTCQPNHIWVQSHHKCMDTSLLQPAVVVQPTHHEHYVPVQPKVLPPQPHPHHTQAHAKGSNPCDGINFYFAVLGDPKSFIQCDAFNKSFVRPCASSSVWDDSIKTCVKNQGIQPKTIAAVQVNNYDYEFVNAKPLNYGDNYGNVQYAGVDYQGSTNAVTRQQKCDVGDLWIPSLQVCASLADAVRGSDYCHYGDLYFPKYEICASVKEGGMEGKSLPSTNSYTFTYTDYDSYVTDNKESEGATNEETRSDNHCAATYKDYTGPNPCNGTFYHAFPHDENCFIQCDQLNVMYVMSCPSSTYWNQEAYQCVRDYLLDSGSAGGDATLSQDYVAPVSHDTYHYNNVNDMRVSGKSLSGNLGSVHHPPGKSYHRSHYAHDIGHLENTCDGKSHTSYRRHPENAHKFVMCMNKVAYPMWCPHANLWRQDIQTCFWPTKPHHHY